VKITQSLLTRQGRGGAHHVQTELLKFTYESRGSIDLTKAHGMNQNSRFRVITGLEDLPESQKVPART
jgi:hypothetical protein